MSDPHAIIDTYPTNRKEKNKWHNAKQSQLKSQHLK